MHESEAPLVFQLYRKLRSEHRVVFPDPKDKRHAGLGIHGGVEEEFYVP